MIFRPKIMIIIVAMEFSMFHRDKTFMIEVVLTMAKAYLMWRFKL